MNADFTLGLHDALDKPGCPICRIGHEVERRYLFHLLYENVNDLEARMHLVRSHGFCPRHAWQAQAITFERLAGGGAAMIYEDLAGRMSSTLERYLLNNLAVNGLRRTRLQEWLEKRGQLGGRLAALLFPKNAGPWLAADLSSSAPCRACEMVSRSQETNVRWLVEKAEGVEFRDRYAASGGLCLPHLRSALAHARDEETARFLVQVAADKLASVRNRLDEYLRKRDWKYHDEPRYPWEEASWIRAVAFFAGEADEEEGSSVYRVRREALTLAREDHQEQVEPVALGGTASGA